MFGIKMKLYTVITILSFYNLRTASSFILAYNSVNGTHEYEDVEADFGSGIVEGGLTGVLVFANPYDGCSKMQTTPYPTRGDMGNITMPTFALIERGKCDFAIKVLNAQHAGFSAAIVYNDVSNMVLKMSTKLPATAHEIYIPAVFVGLQSGKQLNTSYLYNKPGGSYVRIVEGSFDPIQYYLVPFIIVISICFLSLLLFMLVRCVRDRRRTRRNRLSLARLKQLPVKKFQKGDEYDVCAICLDEYEEGDKLRILPCKHAYHCKCVDPWLTSSKRVCPLCKQKVLSDDESSDSDDDESDDERTPLVGSSAATSPNAANWATGFSRQNPIMRALRRNLRRNRLSSDDTSTDTEGPDLIHNDQSPLIHNQQQSAIMREEPSDVFIQQNEVQRATIDEAEPCCSYGNSSSPTIVRQHSDRSEDLMHSAEVYIVGTNRQSNNSITVLTDEDVSPARSRSSSSGSCDYQSVTETSTLENTLKTSSDVGTSDERFQSMSSEEDDDIIVLTHGSHQSHSEEV